MQYKSSVGNAVYAAPINRGLHHSALSFPVQSCTNLHQSAPLH